MEDEVKTILVIGTLFGTIMGLELGAIGLDVSNSLINSVVLGAIVFWYLIIVGILYSQMENKRTKVPSSV